MWYVLFTTIFLLPNYGLDRLTSSWQAVLKIGTWYTDACRHGYRPRSCKVLSSRYRSESVIELTTLATASYRLLPTIEILSPILNQDADKFVSCFPKGVARVILDENRTKRAEVVNPRLDTVSREVLRHEEFQGKVKLGRVRDHFICTFFMCVFNFLSLGWEYRHIAARGSLPESGFITPGKVSKIEIWVGGKPTRLIRDANVASLLSNPPPLLQIIP